MLQVPKETGNKKKEKTNNKMEILILYISTNALKENGQNTPIKRN